MAKAKNAAVKVRIVSLKHSAGLPLPAYQSDGAAGLDLLAAVDQAAPVVLTPGQRALVPTGLIFELPSGFEAQVRPRSGLALKHGVTVLNSPGTIDSDYRGEVKIILVNLGQEPFTVNRGDRIAQLVVAPVSTAKLAVSEAVTETKRGAGGFGSTSSKRAARNVNPRKGSAAKSRSKSGAGKASRGRKPRGK